MNKNHTPVGLYLCFAMAITMVSAQVQGIEGETMSIACSVAGTLPRWIKDSTTSLTLEGISMINPEYSTRFSYAADQKTLIVSPVQPSDAGTYGCIIGGISGTDVVVSVITSNLVKCSVVYQTVHFYFIVTMVINTVVFITCIYTLIKEDMKHNILIVWVILITVVVISIAVLAWFKTVDAFQKMTISSCNVDIGLLSFEVVALELGVCFIFYLFTSRVMKQHSKPQSGDTEQHHHDVSPQHRPQPALPPDEKNVTVVDQMYNQLRTNNLASLDHTVVHVEETEEGQDEEDQDEEDQDEEKDQDEEDQDDEEHHNQMYNQPRTNNLAPLDDKVMHVNETEEEHQDEEDPSEEEECNAQ